MGYLQPQTGPLALGTAVFMPAAVNDELGGGTAVYLQPRPTQPCNRAISVGNGRVPCLLW
ncbi:MAG: hypothetical protein GY803_13195 [Chloroflexi bacterium]|nr:hypothetical protein [Chloroflexota bacterium]